MQNACLLFFAIGGDNHSIDEYFRQAAGRFADPW
jgi:hypothetical protein